MAKKGPVQIKLEFYLIRSLLAVFGLLPRSVSIFISQLLVRSAFRFLPGLRRIAMINTSIAFPEMPEAERKGLVKGSFNSLGRVLAELSRFPGATPESVADLVQYNFEGLGHEREYYDAQAAKGRGTILAGPHLGNWEVGVFAYSATRRPISYLARRMDNPLIEDHIGAIRGQFGNRAINKSNSMGEAMEILRSGGVLGVLPDVNVQSKDGVFVQFFGVNACTTAGVALLAKRTNALILTMCCPWDEEAGQYVVHHGSLIEAPDTGDRHRDILETTAALTADMEKFVRAFPDQWLWIHKRWKTRPLGEPDLYAKRK